MFTQSYTNILKRINQLHQDIENAKVELSIVIDGGDLRENHAFEILKNKIKQDQDEIVLLTKLITTHSLINLETDFNSVKLGCVLNVSGKVIKINNLNSANETNERDEKIALFFNIPIKLPNVDEIENCIFNQNFDKKFVVLTYPDDLFLLYNERELEKDNNFIIINDEKFYKDHLLNKVIGDCFHKIEYYKLTNIQYVVEYKINKIESLFKYINKQIKLTTFNEQTHNTGIPNGHTWKKNK